MNQGMAFRFACEGLVQLVRDAANPAYPQTQAYRTDIIGEAVWMAQFVMRKARAHGWYPTTAQLAAETPEAQWTRLITLDIDPALELVE